MVRKLKGGHAESCFPKASHDAKLTQTTSAGCGGNEKKGKKIGREDENGSKGKRVRKDEERGKLRKI